VWLKTIKRQSFCKTVSKSYYCNCNRPGKLIGLRRSGSYILQTICSQIAVRLSVLLVHNHLLLDYISGTSLEVVCQLKSQCPHLESISRSSGFGTDPQRTGLRRIPQGASPINVREGSVFTSQSESLSSTNCFDCMPQS
jgi:hypothetical protein